MSPSHIVQNKHNQFPSHDNCSYSKLYKNSYEEKIVKIRSLIDVYVFSNKNCLGFFQINSYNYIIL